MTSNHAPDLDEAPRDDPRADYRRQRLIELINHPDHHFYGRTSIFCKKAGKNASLVSQYIHGSKNMGERFCADVEAALNLPGWFSGSDAAPSTPDPAPAPVAAPDVAVTPAPVSKPPCFCAETPEEIEMLAIFRALDNEQRQRALADMMSARISRLTHPGGGYGSQPPKEKRLA